MKWPSNVVRSSSSSNLRLNKCVTYATKEREQTYLWPFRLVTESYTLRLLNQDLEDFCLSRLLLLDANLLTLLVVDGDDGEADADATLLLFLFSILFGVELANVVDAVKYLYSSLPLVVDVKDGKGKLKLPPTVSLA